MIDPELMKLALAMIADPDLVGKEWSQVMADQKLDRHKKASGDTFCSVMHSNWIYANLAALIAAGDSFRLQAFIERADPKGTVRKTIKDGVP